MRRAPTANEIRSRTAMGNRALQSRGRTAPTARQQWAQLAARQRAYRRYVLLFTVGITAAGTLLAIYLLPVFILLYGGMLPSLVAFFLDERAGHHLFRTVFVMNLAGIVGFLEPAWRMSSRAGMVGYPVADPTTWVVMWGSALAGFGLAWTVAVVMNFVLDVW